VKFILLLSSALSHELPARPSPPSTASPCSAHSPHPASHRTERGCWGEASAGEGVRLLEQGGASSPQQHLSSPYNLSEILCKKRTWLPAVVLASQGHQIKAVRRKR